MNEVLGDVALVAVIGGSTVAVIAWRRRQAMALARAVRDVVGLELVGERLVGTVGGRKVVVHRSAQLWRRPWVHVSVDGLPAGLVVTVDHGQARVGGDDEVRVAALPVAARQALQALRDLPHAHVRCDHGTLRVRVARHAGADAVRAAVAFATAAPYAAVGARLVDIATSDPNPVTRRAATRLLGAHGDAGLRAARALLQDADPGVRALAGDALGDVGPAVAALGGPLSDGARAAAVFVVCRRAAPGFEAVARDALVGPGEVAAGAATGLAGSEDPAAAALLAALARDPDPAIRAAVHPVIDTDAARGAVSLGAPDAGALQAVE